MGSGTTGFGAGASIPTLASAVRAVVAHRAVATPTAGNAGRPSITTGSKTRARAGWSRTIAEMTAAHAESGWSQKDIQNLSVVVDCSDFNCRKISRPIR